MKKEVGVDGEIQQLLRIKCQVPPSAIYTSEFNKLCEKELDVDIDHTKIPSYFFIRDDHIVYI